MRRAVLFGVAWLSLAGCGKDDEPSPGMEGGACLAGDVCAEPLTCASNVCVDLTDVGEGSEGAGEGVGDGTDAGGDGFDDGNGLDEDGFDDGGGDGMGVDLGSGGGDGDGGAEVYCGGDSEGCLCGHSADYGPPNAECSTSTVTSPGICCASEGWPGYGGCSCWHLSCRRLSSDTCYCGLGGVDPEDEPVSSCAPEGGICCQDGTTCACYSELTQCVFDGEVEVSSCSVSSLNCGDSSSVASCS